MPELGIQTKVSIEIFPAKIEQVTNTPDGPAGQHIKFVCQLILKGAIPRIGDKYSGHHPGVPLMRTTGSVEPIGGSQHAVVFRHPAAFIHHEGAKPHTITPGNPRGMGRKGPGVVTSWGAMKFWTKKSVSHPGSHANPFLVDSAKELGLNPSGSLLRGDRPTSIFRLRQL